MTHRSNNDPHSVTVIAISANPESYRLHAIGFSLSETEMIDSLQSCSIFIFVYIYRAQIIVNITFSCHILASFLLHNLNKLKLYIIIYTRLFMCASIVRKRVLVKILRFIVFDL